MSLTDLAALASPAFIIGGFLIAIARWMWKRYETQQAHARASLEEFNTQLNQKLLDRLDTQDGVQQKTLEQAQKTNGRVDGLEQGQRSFEKEHAVFRERLSHVEGQTEVLLREKGLPL